MALELGNLKRTVERGAAFGGELTELRRVTGSKLDLSVLDRYKEQGVPTLGELQREFRSLAHTVIAVPFVVVPVLTALEMLDPNLARAAAACGATPATAFFRVTLPAIVPAMGSGALFAFAASFDDVVIALLVAGPDQRTLPREMFSGLRDSITPALTAVATILIVFSTAMFLLVQSLQRRARRAAAARTV